MRKLIVSTFASLDGIMQAPGARNEDQSGGFKDGGWIVPYADEDFGRIVIAWIERRCAQGGAASGRDRLLTGKVALVAGRDSRSRPRYRHCARRCRRNRLRYRAVNAFQALGDESARDD